uniref:Papilin n=1 Tax=Magallana gigas TaxID=29159 RepID=K1S2I8_MAGGI
MYFGIPGPVLQCRVFFYSGCQGNENRFQNRQECQRVCGNGGAGEDVCTLPAVTGPCRANRRRFYYNSVSGQCELFRYGGCQGNRNNFPSLQACQQRCGGDGGIFPPAVCRLPSASGPCRAFFPRWSYSMTSGQCERFVYGGCAGNGNNFQTRQQCEDTCSNAGGGNGNQICILPEDSGPCMAAIPRWHYNARFRRCERFLYGGCQGNENNFESWGQCQRSCGRRVG